MNRILFIAIACSASNDAWACLCDAGIGHIEPVHGATGVPVDTRLLAVGTASLEHIQLTEVATGALVPMTEASLSWDATGVCGYGTDHRFVPVNALSPNTTYRFQLEEGGSLRRSVFTTGADTTPQPGDIGLGLVQVGAIQGDTETDLDGCNDGQAHRMVELCLDAPPDALGRVRLVRTDPTGQTQDVWDIVETETTSLRVRADVATGLDCFLAQYENGAGEASQSQILCMDVDPLVDPGDCPPLVFEPTGVDTGDTAAIVMDDEQDVDSEPALLPDNPNDEQLRACGCTSTWASGGWWLLCCIGAMLPRRHEVLVRH